MRRVLRVVPPPARRGRGGFTYVLVLLTVALLGIGLGAAGTAWSTLAKRDKEAELLFAGDQIRRAIGLYFEASPGAKQFPRRLEELLEDKRFPNVRRHLRRPFIDPMTASAEWELITRPDGAIIGVRSRSTEQPLKKSGFRPEDERFASAATYRDWSFVYSPQPPGAPAAAAPRSKDD